MSVVSRCADCRRGASQAQAALDDSASACPAVGSFLSMPPRPAVPRTKPRLLAEEVAGVVICPVALVSRLRHLVHKSGLKNIRHPLQRARMPAAAASAGFAETHWRWASLRAIWDILLATCTAPRRAIRQSAVLPLGSGTVKFACDQGVGGRYSASHCHPRYDC